MKHIPGYVWITMCVIASLLTVLLIYSIVTASTAEVEVAGLKLKLTGAKLTDAATGFNNNLKEVDIANTKLEEALKKLGDAYHIDQNTYTEISDNLIPSEDFDKWDKYIRNLKYEIEAIPYPGGKLWLGGTFKEKPE